MREELTEDEMKKKFHDPFAKMRIKVIARTVQKIMKSSDPFVSLFVCGVTSVNKKYLEFAVDEADGCALIGGVEVLNLRLAANQLEYIEQQRYNEAVAAKKKAKK